jgi:Cysteine-rich secretory protein family
MLRGARLGLAWLALVSCKQEQEAPAAYPAQPVLVAPAPAAQPTTPSGAAPPPTMPPAVGFACNSDLDPQCPFGRCLAGRCGGCRGVSECKTGAQCLPTWVGQACLPLLAPSAPTPTPTAAPAPAPAPAATATPTPAPAAPPPATAPLEAARQLCVQRTNEYRARVGAAPVARRADAEACGDAQARADGTSRTAHGSFGQCRERAQNECPGWRGSASEVVDGCLAMMFAEGPGAGPAHGHYTNMTDGKYRGVACGFAQAADGGLWVVQNFYP